jgi:hypothetical protein
MSVVNRIMNRVQMIPEARGCWLWEGFETADGYGRVMYDGKSRFVHRVMYEAVRGAIPEGLVIDHLCRMRSCCNPDHLEVVTRLVNNQRGIYPPARYSLRDECSRGHRYAESGYYTKRVYSKRKGSVVEWRICKVCHNDRRRAIRRIAA